MKTLQEHLKESYNKNVKGLHPDFIDFNSAEGRGGYTWIYEAMKNAISEACREQREICYTEARIDRDLGGDIYIIEDSIKNAPEPKMI